MFFIVSMDQSVASLDVVDGEPSLDVGPPVLAGIWGPFDSREQALNELPRYAEPGATLGVTRAQAPLT